MEPLKTFDHLEKKVLEASRLIQNLRDKKIDLEDEVKRLKDENGNLKNRQNLIKEKINILLRQIPIDKSRIMK
jgi:chromosome segregation ATPase